MEVLTTVDEERIARLLADGTFFWLDLLRPSARDLNALASQLGMHPAAIEDTREWDQLPRLDTYGDHVLLVFYSARSIEDRVEPVEAHLYVSGAWIVTACRCETGLERRRERLRDKDFEDEDQLLYHVLDALADGWDPVIDEVDRRVDEVEGAVLARPQQGQLTAIYRLKQEVGELLRHASPQRATFGQAVDVIHHLEGTTHGARTWLRDVETHVDSIDSDLRRLSADLSALTDTFFNANANRLNRLATLIAVGSMFFLIWTLVTGFFGQNFGYLVRHIDSRAAFFAYEIGALLIPTVVLAAILYWRRRDWW